MAHKKEIKTNEARILIYLNNATVRIRYTRMISSKLGIDYGYTIGLLKGMVERGWVKPEKMQVKTYYHIRKGAPIEAAKEVLREENKRWKIQQKRLDVDENV